MLRRSVAKEREGNKTLNWRHTASELPIIELLRRSFVLWQTIFGWNTIHFFMECRRVYAKDSTLFDFAKI